VGVCHFANTDCGCLPFYIIDLGVCHFVVIDCGKKNLRICAVFLLNVHSMFSSNTLTGSKLQTGRTHLEAA
jgi:hypothetical protein